MTPAPPRPPADHVVTSPSGRREAVLQVIRDARSSLALSLFRCTDKTIFKELALARQRGVEVDVLVTSPSSGGRKRLRKLRRALEATGASIHAHVDPVVKYHAKYLVADNGPALVASLNFTRKCFERTIDAIVVTHDPAVVAGLRQLIAADKAGLDIPDGLCPRLIIGPERARRQFSEIIGQAKSSIRLIDAKASDPALTVLLRERRAAGLRVDLYEGKRFGDLRSHGKIMLVDDALAIVGGLSLNALSLDFRREVAVTVDAPDAVAEVARLFETVAAAVNDAPPPADAGTCDPSTGRA